MLMIYEEWFDLFKKNSIIKGFIVCCCKKCCLGKTLRVDIVYDHLTSGARILEGYTEWVMHGETINVSVNREPISKGSNMAPINRMPIHDGFAGMQAMLNDVFTMCDVRVEEGGTQVGVEDEVGNDDC
jgi:hypothetical protein